MNQKHWGMLAVPEMQALLPMLCGQHDLNYTALPMLLLLLLLLPRLLVLPVP